MRLSTAAPLLAALCAAGCSAQVIRNPDMTSLAASSPVDRIVAGVGKAKAYLQLQSSVVSHAGANWDTEYCSGTSNPLVTSKYGVLIGVAIDTPSMASWAGKDADKFVPALALDYGKGDKRICSSKLQTRFLSPLALFDGEPININFFYEDIVNNDSNMGEVMQEAAKVAVALDPVDGVAFAGTITPLAQAVGKLDKLVGKAINKEIKASFSYPESSITVNTLRESKKITYVLPLSLKDGEDIRKFLDLHVTLNFRPSIFSPADSLRTGSAVPDWSDPTIYNPETFIRGVKVAMGNSGTPKQIASYFKDEVMGDDDIERVKKADDTKGLALACERIKTRVSNLALTAIDQAVIRWSIAKQNPAYEVMEDFSVIDACLGEDNRALLVGTGLKMNPPNQWRSSSIRPCEGHSDCAAKFSEEFSARSDGDFAKYLDSAAKLTVKSEKLEGNTLLQELAALKGSSGCYTQWKRPDIYTFLTVSEDGKRAAKVDILFDGQSRIVELALNKPKVSELTEIKRLVCANNDRKDFLEKVEKAAF